MSGRQKAEEGEVLWLYMQARLYEEIQSMPS